MLFHRTLSKVTDSLSVSTEVGRSDMGLEQLEPRRLLSSYVVDTTVDESDGDYSAGDLSLREAIELANADAAEDTITFSTVAFSGGGTITLGGSSLEIEEDLIIAGAAGNVVTVDANQLSGVFEIDNATVQLSYLTITGGNTNAGGAGIYSEDANVILHSVTVSENVAQMHGGGIHLDYSTLTVFDSTISENEAGGIGGAVYTNRSDLSIYNSTISHNTSSENAGGIYISYTDTLIVNSTLVFNVSINGRGGGIASNGIGTGQSDFRVHNSIIVGNEAGQDPDVSATFDVGTHNLIGDESNGRGLTDGVDGNIIGIANVGGILDFNLFDNGGDTRTHALFNGSPAVDAGSNTESSNAGLTEDQRGEARVQGGSVDIGAYELLAPTYDLVLSNNTIPENIANNAPVGTVTLSGTAPASYTFSLLNNAEGRFQIDSVTGVVTVADTSLVDYETSDVFQLVVELTEAGGDDFAKVFGIQVTDEDDPIKDLDLSHFFVSDEFVNGDTVGVVSVSDDDPMTPHQFELLDDAGGRFDIDAATGQVAIENASLIDSATNSNHQIQVRVTDDAALQFDKTFTIQVVSSGTLIVDTNLDELDTNYGASDLSLREAMEISNQMWGRQTITFDSSVNTIVLDGTRIDITDDVTMYGRLDRSIQIDGDGRSRLFFIHPDQDVYMSHLTLSGGYAIGTDFNGRGGAIALENASLTIEHSTVSDNQTDDNGIGNNSYGTGGGISALSSSLILRDSILENNIAKQGGGAFNASRSSLLMERVTVRANQARRGGGFSAYETDDVVILDSTIESNSSSLLSGGIWFSRGVTGSIVNTTIQGNTAQGRGGGFHSFSSDVAFINSTVSGNHTSNEGGGGISVDTSTLTLVNSTITGNSTDATGGGINNIGGSSYFAFYNAIVAGNTSAGTFNDVADPIAIGQNNLIGDAASSGGLTDGVNGNIVGVGGVGIRDINTILDTTLRDNGGFTKTHALMNGSAAIGAGDVSLLPADTPDIDGDLDISESLPLDQNGRDRVIGSLDIGAVEHVDWGLRLFSENHLSFMENSTDAVVQIDAGSVNSSELTYQIIGGADQSLFSVNGAEVFFVSPPDYETPLDHNGNNVYQVKVSVSDGVIIRNQMLYINVLNNGAPIITSAGRGHITENATGPVYTVVGSDPEGDSLTYSIEGGQDQGLFSTNGSGEIRFITPPDYETPLDHNGNNIYIVKIGVSDGENLKTKTIYIDVYNNRMPVITSPARGNIVENDTAAVYTVAGTDPDGDTLSYTIEGGHDASLFSINGSGEIRFITPPDYETPLDHNGNNIYIVKIGVSDGENLKTKTIYIDVYNNRMPVITSPARGGITENLSGVAYSLTATDLDDEEADLVYSIEGGQDASLFTMDIDGNISFISAPDFESPLDHNGNNVYIVKVGVSDGENLKTKTIYIDVYNAAG